VLLDHGEKITQQSPLVIGQVASGSGRRRRGCRGYSARANPGMALAIRGRLGAVGAVPLETL
jgi:hypothetical protein